MQTINYTVDDEGFAPFTKATVIDTFISADAPTEIFYLFKDKDCNMSAIPELLKSGRHVHRHCLADLPFVLIYSSTNVYAAHIARDVMKPSIDEADNVIEALEYGLILFNQLAMAILLGTSDLEYMTSATSDIIELFLSNKGPNHSAIELFYIRTTE